MVTRKVRINKVSGYREGEEVDLPENRALTYCQNGQASPVGWDPRGGPLNRMMDTSGVGPAATRRKTASKKKKVRKPRPDDDE